MSKADILTIFSKSASSSGFSISVNGTFIYPVAYSRKLEIVFLSPPSPSLSIFYYQVQEELFPKSKLMCPLLSISVIITLILGATISDTNYCNSLQLTGILTSTSWPSLPSPGLPAFPSTSYSPYSSLKKMYKCKSNHSCLLEESSSALIWLTQPWMILNLSIFNHI